MFLDYRLSYTQLINAVSDRLNRQRHCPVLQFGQGLRLHGKRPGVFCARIEIIFWQTFAYDVAQI